jgi:hypothetical protein
MASDWDIKSRSHECSRTGRGFEKGERFYTVLTRQGDGFLREDLSEEAWRERNDNIQPFSFWQSTYEPPAPPPPEPLPKDDAEALLRSLVQENDPSRKNARYVLALMLERKRLLQPVESTDPDVLVYEHVATGETIVIENPRLGLDRIPEVQREVGELLSGA